MTDFTVKSFRKGKLAVTTASEAGTLALGGEIGRILEAGAWLALTGILGSGKTRLVKGIAKGLGVADADGVASPTYTICAEHHGRLKLYHFDAYRLSGAAEFEDAASDALDDDGAVAAVEWAERVAAALPDDRVETEIGITGETDREFAFAATGKKSLRFLDSLAKKLKMRRKP